MLYVYVCPCAECGEWNIFYIKCNQKIIAGTAVAAAGRMKDVTNMCGFVCILCMSSSTVRPSDWQSIGGNDMQCIQKIQKEKKPYQKGIYSAIRSSASQRVKRVKTKLAISIKVLMNRLISLESVVKTIILLHAHTSNYVDTLPLSLTLFFIIKL